MFRKRKPTLGEIADELELLELKVVTYNVEQQAMAEATEDKIFELEQKAAVAHGNAYRATQTLIKIREALKAIND